MASMVVWFSAFFCFGGLLKFTFDETWTMYWRIYNEMSVNMFSDSSCTNGHTLLKVSNKPY